LASRKVFEESNKFLEGEGREIFVLILLMSNIGELKI